MNQDHVFYSSLDPAEGRKRFLLPGLDGLRALAVATVLVYHLWPQLLPGGMIGVDIFFVISGFLITALLLREGAFYGRINIVQFWVRRARRLLPAIAVLVAAVGTAALVVGGDVQVGLGRQILGAFTFSSNWLYIAADNDYFAQTSPELLTNFWSLAVEEQFYIFWPVLLVFVFMFVARWGRRALVPAVLGGFSLVLGAFLLLTGSGVSRVYYGTDTHLFGLMLGVLLAFLLPWSMYPPADERLYPVIGYGERWAGALRAMIGWLSLFAVVPLALVLSDRSGLFMPWGLLLASLLAVGVIQALVSDVHNPAAHLLRKFLSFPVFVWLGKRSYGIYLWHWPLHVLSHYIFGAGAAAWVQVLVLLVTLLVAGLSYMYVEEPIRTLGFRGAFARWGSAMCGPAKVAPIGAAVALVLGSVGAATAVATAPVMTEAESVVAAGAAGQKEGGVRIEPSSPAPSASASEEAESDDEGEQKPVEQASVSIVGDSVTLASATSLQEVLPQATIDAEVSRTLIKEIPVLEQQASAGELGDVVVISLSTNSTISAEQVDEVLAALSPAGERRVVFVTGQAPANLTWVAGSNDVVKQVASERSDVMSVADWAAVAGAHPEYLVSDGVHPELAGQQAYAKVVRDAVVAAAEDMGKTVDSGSGGESASAEPQSPATEPAW